MGLRRAIASHSRAVEIVAVLVHVCVRSRNNLARPFDG